MVGILWGRVFPSGSSLIPVTELKGGGGAYKTSENVYKYRRYRNNLKVLGYLCISWGMGAEGDPFQNPGGGGRSGAALGESRPVWVIILLPDHKG